MRLSKMDKPFEFDDLIDGFWVLDIKNEMVYLSPNASKLFGHRRPVSMKIKNTGYFGRKIE